MIPYMVGKLAPNSSHLTEGLVKYVPHRSYFCAVFSQNGEKYVTSPSPPIVELVGSAVVSIVMGVRESEFTEKATIGCVGERLVGARVESHPAISIRQEGASHCVTRDDVYPCRKGCGRRTVVVKRNGHSGMSVCAE